ncbi:WecB/TagA/CpsF family glycosyltransferase [Enterococcus sp. AZ109]|uniref:WecB/TagA/CpsF family glycosyltransferase n=1 Tax=Enterococcus sp. AZ109 TaxID=2774634 RepID=UPI003F26D353
MPKINFLNTNIDNLTLEQTVEEVKKLIDKKEAKYLVTPNLDHIVLLEEDDVFRDIYKNASLVLADGKPLIWISKFKKNPIIEKISGSDLFPKICEMAAKEGYSIFILGAAEGVADKAGENLCAKYKDLKIVGTYSPRYGFEENQEEVEAIIENIKSNSPDILAVSLGSPKGEKFIYNYLDELNVPISMSIGATIDFEAGNVKRAPKWMCDHGFEWMYRISQEPNRLIKRYLNDAIKILPIIRKYS